MGEAVSYRPFVDSTCRVWMPSVCTAGKSDKRALPHMSSTLQTVRLVLRPFEEGDLDLLTDLMANSDFMRFSSGVFSREKTQAFLEKVLGWNRAGLPSQFGVTLGETGRLIGYCGFFHQQVDGESEIEIGYRLHPDYWNKGYATEGACAVRDHGFRDLRLSRVISLIHPQNVASRRVAEKVGMHLERRTIFKTFPTLVFAMAREQWAERNAV
jgi:RimJ/RimL family protein N-acetyltransferase